MMMMFFLKMNEAWSNASSLRYEFMVLKNLNLINFLSSPFLKVVMQVMMIFFIIIIFLTGSKTQNRVNEPWGR